MTAVVLHELTKRATGSSEINRWGHVMRAREADGTLLVPTAEDWWEVGRTLNHLRRNLSFRGQPPPQKLEDDPIDRLTRDALIARLVRRENITLVTDNIRDFELIGRRARIRCVTWAEFNG